MQEIRPWIGKAPFSEPPIVAGYRLHRAEQINLARASILGVLLVPVWMMLFAAVPMLLGNDGLQGTLTPVTVIVAVILAAMLIVFHELLHGVAILLSGKMPSFGAGPGFFYTTCHVPLTRNAYLTVVLMPLLVINLGAAAIAAVFPGATGWMLFLSILNTMGAGGDVWMFVRLIRVPSSAMIVDLASGYAIYYPDQATTASPTEH